MTIQKILDNITILKVHGEGLESLKIMLFVAAVIMGVLSVIILRDKHPTGTKAGRIAFGSTVATMAASALAGAIILLCIPLTTTKLTLNVVTNDSVALTDLTPYFDISDISLSPYGTQMTLEINYKHQAFESVINALKDADITIRYTDPHGTPDPYDTQMMLGVNYRH